VPAATEESPDHKPATTPPRAVGLVTSDQLQVGDRIYLSEEMFMPGASLSRTKSVGPATNGMLFEAHGVEIVSIEPAYNLVGPQRHKATIGRNAKMYELRDGRLLFLQGGFVLCDATA
jgi:hypothetical protein